MNSAGVADPDLPRPVHATALIQSKVGRTSWAIGA